MIVTSSSGSKSSRNCIYVGRVNRSPSRPMLWSPNLKGGNLPEALVKVQERRCARYKCVPCRADSSKKCVIFAWYMCDQKSQKQLFSPRRRCLNLLFRQQ